MSYKKHTIAAALFLLPLTFLLAQKPTNKKAKTTAPTTSTPSVISPLEKKVEALLAKMTIEEKAGEMTQLSLDMVCEGSAYNVKSPLTINKEKLVNVIQKLHVGSILNVGTSAHTAEKWQQIITEIQGEAAKSRLKIPVLYGIDAIHGVNYTLNTTLYPQPIAVAATFNTALAEQLASLTAYECRASGIPWVFSPAMDLCRFPLWARTWESFGEDLLMNKTFGSAMVKGYQGNDMGDKFKVAACLKHFTGYGASISGHDRTQAWIPDRQLREYYLPQYEEAIRNGAMSVMVNSSEFNGIPAHVNKQLLTDILKGELKFQGFAVSDWEDVKYLLTRHKVAATYKEAVALAINAGIDMCMVPVDLEFTPLLLENIKEGKIPTSRIDDAVRRILRVKMQLGLFEKTHDPLSNYPKLGGEEFRKTALEAATESLILLKNEKNVLPLPKQGRALVVGPTANSMRSLNGGWTNTWQGEDADKVYESKNTVVEAIKNKIGKDKVTYLQGADFDKTTNAADAIAFAKGDGCDYIVLCLGETSYTEVPGSINDLTLDAPQLALAAELAKAGKPIVLVLNEGRPRIFNTIEPQMNGILLALYGGMESGNAIADVLYGDANPSGKLPITYPKYVNGILPYDHKLIDEGPANAGFPEGKNAYFAPEFPFGFGLSYTNFEYKNLKISQPIYGMNDKIQISIDVSNTGKIDGKEAVLLFVSDLVASIAPSVKRLRGFDKVMIKAGETKTVTFNLTTKDLAFVGLDNKWVTEAGAFKIQIGNQTVGFDLK